MSGKNNIFAQRSFCLITGASRGLGRGIALKFAEKFPQGSLFVLLARDEGDLDKTRTLIANINAEVRVYAQSIDLSTAQPSDYEATLAKALAAHGVQPDSFEQAVIVHNAGSLGNVKRKTTEMEDVEECRNYYDLNLFSVICLNTKFLQIFSENVISKRIIINITSLAAFHPFKSWGYYCSGKAARDMYFRVMAAEDPSLRILSYAPGPLKTDMTIRAREESADEDIRKWFADAYAEGRMLNVEYTVGRLVEILEWNGFKNGDHVDVLDELDIKTVTSP